MRRALLLLLGSVLLVLALATPAAAGCAISYQPGEIAPGVDNGCGGAVPWVAAALVTTSGVLAGLSPLILSAWLDAAGAVTAEADLGAMATTGTAAPVSRDDSLPEATVKVHRKDFHPRGQFDRKMNALSRLSDDGKLFKQANKVARDKRITDGYKKRVRKAILRKYWPGHKQLATKLLQRLKEQHPDHVWELQLGGPDTVSNLQLLHGRTNVDIGSQIWQQIMHLPDGTPIRIEVVG
ncbi:hypothetical protein [Actinoplanes teichomyceticus]|uniref:HNH endonuclease n=1 Tax=Actinoplanes teichomyceticus TaxID=1867 RepID=A0A561WKH9_ACTTI|nr:hypothetical protein [Actinoplanes teichomyceticus]TWG24365.1 hypothetical protein FHX34_102921 [Actinoplanes teichomyceticus]GIF12783.1 hypothetical protein Ate01nite_28150 [Actinoplanes teichomyceticus]